jgi:hypothetical protein
MIMSDKGEIKGALLVGSIPFENCEEVFSICTETLGSHLERIPDGETGERSGWINWQVDKLLENPNLELVPNEEFEYQELRKMIRAKKGVDTKKLDLGELGYSRAALDSYKTFSELKSSGVIPGHIRFQVSLPTPLAITHAYVHPTLQADFEPQHEETLISELNEILDGIPHEELAIQWDTAVEFAVLEGIMPTYLGDIEGGINTTLSRIATAVPEPVELGFHLCYGDAGHKHFCDPKDMTKLVNVSNELVKNIQRSLNWIHMPVPITRTDGDYYKPLADLNLPTQSKLYLGLIHYSDGSDGAEKRINAARQYTPTFGVATECGFGRRDRNTISELLETHKKLSDPVQ